MNLDDRITGVLKKNTFEDQVNYSPPLVDELHADIKQLIRDIVSEIIPERRSKQSREYQLWPDVVNGHTEAIDQIESNLKRLLNENT